VKTFFSDIWNDPAKFTAACRGALVMVGGLVGTGLVHVPGTANDAATSQIIGILLGGFGASMAAGQKNPQPETEKETK
jgi:hypothetical protein